MLFFDIFAVAVMKYVIVKDDGIIYRKSDRWIEKIAFLKFQINELGIKMMLVKFLNFFFLDNKIS